MEWLLWWTVVILAWPLAGLAIGYLLGWPPD